MAKTVTLKGAAAKAFLGLTGHDVPVKTDEDALMMVATSIFLAMKTNDNDKAVAILKAFRAECRLKEPAATLIYNRLLALGTQVEEAFAAAPNEDELKAEQAKVLGKNGALTPILAMLIEVPAEHRPAFGLLINNFKDSVERLFTNRETKLKAQKASAS